MNKLKLFLLAVSITISAASYADGYTIYGAGSSSCGEWVSERATGSWHSKGQWMLGVISAVGYYSVSDLKKIDSQAFAVWMDNYCKENPLSQFSEGVYSLVEELAVKKP